MLGFVSAFGGATLRAPTAFAGCRVAAPAAPAVARWTMVKSKAIPFMEAPPALDGSMIGGTLCGVPRRVCLATAPRTWARASVSSVGASRQDSDVCCAAGLPTNRGNGVWSGFLLPGLTSHCVSPTDVGFDPFGFSNYIDLKFLREAEIKHCRITMLAVLGLFVQEFYTLPFYSGPALAEPSHNFYVAHGAMKQLLLWTSGLEIITGVPALLQMMQGSPRRPGEFGFDPLGLAKNNAAFARWQNAELINGRLAMIAVGGLIHQVSCSTPARVLCSESLSGDSRDFWPTLCLILTVLSSHRLSVARSRVA